MGTTPDRDTKFEICLQMGTSRTRIKAAPAATIGLVVNNHQFAMTRGDAQRLIENLQRVLYTDA